jgi:hypothetical protein
MTSLPVADRSPPLSRVGRDVAASSTTPAKDAFLRYKLCSSANKKSASGLGQAVNPKVIGVIAPPGAIEIVSHLLSHGNQKKTGVTGFSSDRSASEPVNGPHLFVGPESARVASKFFYVVLCHPLSRATKAFNARRTIELQCVCSVSKACFRIRLSARRNGGIQRAHCNVQLAL